MVVSDDVLFYMNKQPFQIFALGVIYAYGVVYGMGELFHNSYFSVGIGRRSEYHLFEIFGAYSLRARESKYKSTRFYFFYGTLVYVLVAFKSLLKVSVVLAKAGGSNIIMS